MWRSAACARSRRSSGTGADDQRANVPPFAPEPRHRPQHVLVPLLPDEPAGTEHEMAVAAAASHGIGRVDARRRHLAAVGRRALEQEHAACALGRRQEQVDARDRLASLPAPAEPAVGLAERDRLPHGQHEPEAEPVAEQRRAVAVRHADLRGMHDVGAGELLLEADVAVAEDECGEVADATTREAVAQRPDLLDRQLERGEVERIRARDEHAHVEAIPESSHGRRSQGFAECPRRRTTRGTLIDAARGAARRARRG